jgi:hypothetical protein
LTTNLHLSCAQTFLLHQLPRPFGVDLLADYLLELDVEDIRGVTFILILALLYPMNINVFELLIEKIGSLISFSIFLAQRTSWWLGSNLT